MAVKSAHESRTAGHHPLTDPLENRRAERPRLTHKFQPMGSFLESFTKSKTQEATISLQRWEEEKRVANIREAMTEKNMLLEERKLKLAEDKLQYDLLLLKSQNR